MSGRRNRQTGETKQTAPAALGLFGLFGLSGMWRNAGSLGVATACGLFGLFGRKLGQATYLRALRITTSTARLGTAVLAAALERGRLLAVTRAARAHGSRQAHRRDRCDIAPRTACREYEKRFAAERLNPGLHRHCDRLVDRQHDVDASARQWSRRLGLEPLAVRSLQGLEGAAS